MNRRLATAAFAGVLLLAAGVGLWRASTPDVATDEERMQAVAATLRCPTCQGLSVADSPSQVAGSMRDIVGEQLADGRSPEEVRGWFVERYGSWILLSPQPSGLGWVVWALPVVTVGAGVAAAGAVTRRRRRRGPHLPADTSQVDVTFHRYRSGTLAIPAGPRGDRVEAALALLSSVREDQQVGASSEGAERLAVERVATALAAPAPVVAALPSPVGAGPVHDPGPPRARPVPRALRWGVVLGVFLLAVTAALVVSVRPRAQGDLPTGDAPAPIGAELDDLRAAAEATPDDLDARLALARGLADEGLLEEAGAAYREVLAARPEDTRTRLLLAANLLRAGEPDGARDEAETALAAAPDDPDALLMVGLAQTEQGDGDGPQTLRRFLDLAPPDHPGRQVATGLLAPDQ